MLLHIYNCGVSAMALPPMLVEVVGILEDSPFAAENEIAFTIDT